MVFYCAEKSTNLFWIEMQPIVLGENAYIIHSHALQILSFRGQPAKVNWSYKALLCWDITNVKIRWLSAIWHFHNHLIFFPSKSFSSHHWTTFPSEKNLNEWHVKSFFHFFPQTLSITSYTSKEILSYYSPNHIKCSRPLCSLPGL